LYISWYVAIAIFNTPDVRPILKAYDGKDIPIEYAKKEEESKRAAIEEWERKNPNRSSGGGGFLGGMFGSVSAVCPHPYLFSRDADGIAWTDKTESTYDLPRPKEGTGSEDVRGRTEILERKRRGV
jgi:hypothetical protein